MGPKIQIITWDNVFWYVEDYTGKGTNRAIKSRLTRERNNGYRARALVYSHEGPDGPVGIDFETRCREWWLPVGNHRVGEGGQQ
jgi:hypothetical protein